METLFIRIINSINEDKIIKENYLTLFFASKSLNSVDETIIEQNEDIDVPKIMVKNMQKDNN